LYFEIVKLLLERLGRILDADVRGQCVWSVMLPAKIQNSHLLVQTWINHPKDGDVVFDHVRFGVRISVIRVLVVWDAVRKVKERNVYGKPRAGIL